MDGVYGGRQVLANWPQDEDECDRAANLAWYRELVAETARALTRWREDGPQRGMPRRCDPWRVHGGRTGRDHRAG